MDQVEGKAKAREFVLKKPNRERIDADFDAVLAIPESECPIEFIAIENVSGYIRVIEIKAYRKAVAALKEIAKDRYEANPWTVVPTAAAKKAEDVLKELGEL